ncbi:hypothetical protein [Bradyrhizobium sp. AT1]|uniref:hypothetical protein n=1 Tax=Bradyrhizobium sp. AT1 TaxID=574934 RepID=UPI000A8EB800|nr:hypothetical protein [Bradyrhizobium sp. AT1]
MSETTTLVDIESKEDAKVLIEIFLGHDKTTKIEIKKDVIGYKGQFTVQDPAHEAVA